MHYFSRFYFILLTCIALQAQATETSRSFYAISSLCAHLHEKLSSDSSGINFSDADLSALWDVAAVDSTCSDDVALARECYNLDLLKESQVILEESWRNLNPYWSNSASIVEKGQGQLNFLLPKKAHLRKRLDEIFSDPNILNTPETFASAGFVTISERRSGMVVASHPSIPRNLVKAYILSRKPKPNWEWAVFRCWGCSNIKTLIKEKRLHHFVMPHKWIYPLTDFKATTGNLIEVTSPAVLVVSYMRLVDRNASREAWKTVVTRRHVEELYCILSHGYSSCLLFTNIPYTTNGKFACIDTEWPSRPLPLGHVHRHLSEEMAQYWDHLVRTGGKGGCLFN